MRDRNLRKYRTCRFCGKELHTDSQGLKIHAAICSFEKRTGLTVVRGDTSDFSLRVLHEDA